MTKYDYLNGNKKVLSSDGKRHDIVLIKGFNDSEVLLALGIKGYLTGEALSDYEKMLAQQQ